MSTLLSNMYKCLRNTFALLLILVSFAAGAQKRILHELPNLKVNDFYQDTDNYVWISTDYGICKYNGTDYVHYFYESDDAGSLPSNNVVCSTQDKIKMAYCGF